MTQVRAVIPILGRSRIRRQERRIEWPVSRRTHFKFQELLQELVYLETRDQTDPIVLDRMACLRDDIRHLPGYPRDYHPEWDVIVPVVTTEQG
ncbi:MAG: hypothetical protein ACE5Q6_25390 [Dehalococcoidia bacterium]